MGTIECKKKTATLSEPRIFFGEPMGDNRRELQGDSKQAWQSNEKPARKPWITPTFTLVGDLKDAQVGGGVMIDFNNGDFKPPGLGS